LLLLNTITDCHRRINSHPEGLELDALIYENVARLTDGIVSTIPYLLAADLQVFVENATRESPPPLVAGPPIGDLLSMHALYVLSTLPLTEDRLKVYLKDCLTWIGDSMGIGQAKILSMVRYR
jgi:hypothetical protein